MMGEALRYPLHTVKSGKRGRLIGATDIPHAIIPDVKRVIEAADGAWRDSGSFVSFLMEYEQALLEH